MSWRSSCLSLKNAIKGLENCEAILNYIYDSRHHLHRPRLTGIPKILCLHRHNMGAALALVLGALCQLLLCASINAAGEVSSVLGCKASELLTGVFCTLFDSGHKVCWYNNPARGIGVTSELMFGSRLRVFCAGPNELQVAKFRSKLSDPTALKTHFSYHYSASLITDGLANGTDPVYVYTMPRCDSQPTTSAL